MHLLHTLRGTDPNEVVNIFRNFIAMGGALMFVGTHACASDSRGSPVPSRAYR
ncbi:hypothetical protein [Hymenobacter terrenus]|uniref:hypothetical protein n=1 Tax=Hymenobacter terrenus TaxID=1629124 RepID=UPI000ADBC3F5|nr:hypothetical protein [Hymenobacter terrenus]